MQRIQGAKLLLSGLQGLGAEVAKNLVLMGVGSLTLHDPHPTCWSDLAAQVRLLGGALGFQTRVGVGPKRKLLAKASLGHLFSFCSQSRTWEGAGLRPLKNSWLSSMEPFRCVSTQATSPRTCCWISRCPPSPTLQAKLPHPQGVGSKWFWPY